VPTATTATPSPALTADEQILQDLTSLIDRPLAYVYWAFPWGEGELYGEDGPDTWQRELLLELEEALRTSDTSIRFAAASGNGVGKGAITAWIAKWFHDTRPDGKGLITANTGDQLSTKTWSEVAKWHKLSKTAHWSHWQATKLSHLSSPETWFVSALPWSKERPESMAGMHAPHILVEFDEASAIIDPIWDTLEGAMSGAWALWFAWGNPTRNSGRFKEIFPGGLYAHEWRTRRIDSRTCKKTNKAQLDGWIATRGLDSDFVKIHVLGEHPRQSEEQFIGADIVEAAQHREEAPYLHLPKILGADVATTNRGALLLRQGCKILWLRDYYNKQPDEWAALITSIMDTEQPDATFVDAVGVGAGVYALLRHTNHYVIAVNGAHAVPELAVSTPNQPSEKDIYYNMRACMWGRMKEWLREWGCLPHEYTGLARELQEPQWTYAGKNQILLESKEDMRARGIASPDEADSLSVTFYSTVRHKRVNGQVSRTGQAYATPSASPLAPRGGLRMPQMARGGLRR
jgi:hypothetical protein